MKRVQYILTALLVAGSLALACSSPDTKARVDPDPVGTVDGPNLTEFAHVAPMLVRRCGSIDCHGSVYRNMRFFGYGGTRFAPGDRPDSPTSITANEVHADFDAVVGLEPEKMLEVVHAKGGGYNQLTLVRKARNEEDHKGGQRIIVGDPADNCLLSWLAGKTSVADCDTASCALDGGAVQGCEPPFVP